MDSRTVNTEMEALLEHAQWVQELAHKLVRDPSQADDIVQETWVAALAGSSEPVRSTRAWLAMVVKRLVWQRYRSEGRRRSREEFTARDEATASTAEIVERMSAHKQVVEAVMGLPEPYRNVLLRRYFEGETPTEIAEAQKVPISTIKTQLQRGLARLREELDEQNGNDGSTWALVLAPLAQAHDASLRLAAAATPSLVTPLLWAAAIAALVALPFVLSFDKNDGAREETQVSSTRTDLDARISEEEASNMLVKDEARTPLNPRVTPADELADKALVANRRRLQGKVLSAAGTPLAFVLLEFVPRYEMKATGDVVAISDANGDFVMRGALGAGKIRSGRDDLVTICAAEINGSETPTDISVIVADKLSLTGRVFDSAGRALPEARVELLLPPELRASLGRQLDAATPYHPVTESDETGAFSFADAASVLGTTLLVRREGFVDWRGAPTNGEMRITLERFAPAADAEVVRGRVLDAAGSPMVDVRVALDGKGTRTDHDGQFVLPWASDSFTEEPRLVAVAPGLAPGFARATNEDATGWRWSDPLEIRLAQEPLTITGRVVDNEGKPRPGVVVWLASPSLLALPDNGDDEGNLTFELPPDQEISARELPQIAECIALGNRHRPWTTVRTAADGTFELSGLGTRSYRVATLDAATLAKSSFGPFEAGASGVELQLDLNDLVPQLSGRVVDTNGQPLAGLKIRLTRRAEELHHRDARLLTRIHQVEGTRTDSDGRFLLLNVPREGATLSIHSPSIIPRTIPLNELDLDAGGLVLTAMPDTRLRVELTDTEEASSFELLNEEGTVLPVWIERGTEWRLAQRTRLPGGRSEIMRSPLCATTLRLLKEGVAVRDIPIKLEPNRVNLVAP